MNVFHEIKQTLKINLHKKVKKQYVLKSINHQTCSNIEEINSLTILRRLAVMYTLF